MTKNNKNSIQFYIQNLSKKLLLLFIVSYILSTQAMAASFGWYFSQSTGNDSTGLGTIGKPWKSLSKVQMQLDSAGPSDIVIVYFKRGDTWRVNSESTSAYPTIKIKSFKAQKVTLTAYGKGNLPCIDGSVNWLKPANHGSPGVPLKTSSFISVEKSGSTIEYLELKNIYAVPIRINSSGVTIQQNEIHHFGWAGVSQDNNASLANTTIIYNKIHDAVLLTGHFPKLKWSSAISFFWKSNKSSNTFSHNTIYNSYGEGIVINAGVAEKNTIYNCKSGGIHIGAGEGDENMGTIIVRNNLVFGTRDPKYSARTRDGRYYNSDGIVVQDENIKGKNDNGNASIYNNVVIGCDKGIRVYDNQAQAYEPIKSVKIYNNLLIDNYVNLYLGKVTGFSDIDIYDNISVFYDQVDKNFTGGHTMDTYKTLPDPRIYINGNHFYTKNMKTPIVKNGFGNNWIITDPKIPGEAKGIDWDNLSSPSNLNMMTDLPQGYGISNSINQVMAPKNLKILN